MFPLRTASILLRSFLQVSIFLFTLLFQNGFSVLLPLLSFILPILSVVTMQLHAVKNSVSFSDVACLDPFYCLTFPSSTLSFVLSHDLNDGNHTLRSNCITCRILLRRTSAVKTLGSSLAGVLSHLGVLLGYQVLLHGLV